MKLPAPLERHVSDRFGSKRGLVNWLQARLRYLLGGYRQHREVDFSRVTRLVFICSGNICRSPFGAFYAREKGFAVDSYGLDTRGGDPADPRAVAFAAKLGIDMTPHRTRRISEYEPLPGDLLLAMEPAQYQKLSVLAQREHWPSGVQISILPLFGPPPSPYLHDPYSASDVFFEHCERQVMAAVDGIAQRMEDAIR